MYRIYESLVRMSHEDLIEHYDESVRTDSLTARFYLAEIRHRESIMAIQNVELGIENLGKRIAGIENLLNVRRMD